jgi:hypothetical protein
MNSINLFIKENYFLFFKKLASVYGEEFELDRLYSKEKIYSVESIFNNFLSNFEAPKICVF